jgi:hypothetical protein
MHYFNLYAVACVLAHSRLHNTDGRCGPQVFANDTAERASKRVIARKIGTELLNYRQRI